MMSAPSLVKKLTKTKFALKKKKNLFTNNTLEASPVVRASHLWAIVSDQLECLLGETIHIQWFSKLIPTVVSNDVLILRTPNEMTTRWINAHYGNLIDKLLQIHDAELSAFFLSTNDID